jgi:hypothetical protein
MNTTWLMVRAWTLGLRGVLAELGAARLRWCVVAAGSGCGAGSRCVQPCRSPGSVPTGPAAVIARFLCWVDGQGQPLLWDRIGPGARVVRRAQAASSTVPSS